jgi:hypothetical protein
VGASPAKAPRSGAHLVGASSGFSALGKLQKNAFAQQVPEPAKEFLLPISEDDVDNNIDED